MKYRQFLESKMVNAKRIFRDNGAKSFPVGARETSIDRYRSPKCLSLLFRIRILKTIKVRFLTKFGRIMRDRIHACIVKLSSAQVGPDPIGYKNLCLMMLGGNYVYLFQKGIRGGSHQSSSTRN